MLGSSNSIACTNIMLNAAVAESLKVYADELERAADFETALKNLVEGMKGTMADWVIVSITETPLMDVYPFDPERKTKEEDRPQE